MNEITSSLRRTPYQTIASLSVLFFSLLLSGILFVSIAFLQGLLNYVESRPRIIVYFQVKADEKQINELRETIKNTNKTSNITFISKTEAFKIYKEFTKNDPLLLEMTSVDMLPASLEIDAKKPEYLPELAQLLKNQKGVDEVQYQKDIVDNLLSLTSKVRKTTFIFFSYLMFMSIIVLTTTLSFKIALKKEEIGIIKLLGASNRYIRKPYILEGLLLGAAASALTNIILIMIFISLNSFLKSYFLGIPNLTLSIGLLSVQVWPFNFAFVIVTLSVTVIFSLFITLISSLIATNRYLK